MHTKPALFAIGAGDFMANVVKLTIPDSAKLSPQAGQSQQIAAGDAILNCGRDCAAPEKLAFGWGMPHASRHSRADGCRSVHANRSLPLLLTPSDRHAGVTEALEG